MIKITTNSKCLKEKEYIINIIFEEFWEIPHELIIDDSCENIYKFQISEASIICPDIFFSKASELWLSKDSMPNESCELFEIRNLPFSHSLQFEDLPILFGNGLVEKVGDDLLKYEIDILGTMFFVLSRYEEGVIMEKDNHQRFAAKHSHAFKNNYLHRPIVNEYLELLWASFQLFGCDLLRKRRKYHTILTCDVDLPYNPSNQNLGLLLRTVTSLVLKKKELLHAAKVLIEFLLARLVSRKYDANNTFDYLMSLAEEENEVATFFFICDNIAGSIDGNYSITDSFIKDLFKEINSRGHEVGMHGSYTTYNNVQQLKKESSILRNQLSKLEITQDRLGNRQHFLRYDSLQTVKFLDECGFDYDSTLSFADVAGFRCGICYEYSMYDLLNRSKLTIKQSPLIFMECSVIDKRYMGLGYGSEARDYVIKLKEECRKYDGNFVVLWHNSSFTNQEDYQFLRKIITGK